jgi:hypothetical protein
MSFTLRPHVRRRQSWGWQREDASGLVAQGGESVRPPIGANTRESAGQVTGRVHLHWQKKQFPLSAVDRQRENGPGTALSTNTALLSVTCTCTSSSARKCNATCTQHQPTDLCYSTIIQNFFTLCFLSLCAIRSRRPDSVPSPIP